MPRQDRLHRAAKDAAYFIRRLGLALFGPAQLDEEHDPIEALRRQYGRLPKAPRVDDPR